MKTPLNLIIILVIGLLAQTEIHAQQCCGGQQLTSTQSCCNNQPYTPSDSLQCCNDKGTYNPTPPHAGGSSISVDIGPIVQKINSGIHLIPGLSGANISEGTLSGSPTTGDCCPSAGAPHPNGIRGTTGTIELSFYAQNIPIYPPPPSLINVNQTYMNAALGLKATASYKGGVFAKGSAAIAASAGANQNACDSTKSCSYGSAEASLSMGVEATVSGSTCVSIAGGTPSCASFSITPLATTFTCSPNLTYNKDGNCNAGLQGSVSDSSFTVTTKINIVGLTFSGTLYTWNGAST